MNIEVNTWKVFRSSLFLFVLLAITVRGYSYPIKNDEFLILLFLVSILGSSVNLLFVTKWISLIFLLFSFFWSFSMVGRGMGDAYIFWVVPLSLPILINFMAPIAFGVSSFQKRILVAILPLTILSPLVSSVLVENEYKVAVWVISAVYWLFVLMEKYYFVRPLKRG